MLEKCEWPSIDPIAMRVFTMLDFGEMEASADCWSLLVVNLVPTKSRHGHGDAMTGIARTDWGKQVANKKKGKK